MANLVMLNVSSRLSSSARSFLWLARPLHTSSVVEAKRWKKKAQLPFQHELTNPVDIVYGYKEKLENGYVYDRKPFMVSVKKYHVYDWCGCGMSHQQPFCDGTHASPYLKKAVKGGPVRYIAPEDRDIWFCNCKQTEHRPFCDGTHRSEEVQQMQLDGKFFVWEPNEDIEK